MDDFSEPRLRKYVCQEKDNSVSIQQVDDIMSWLERLHSIKILSKVDPFFLQEKTEVETKLLNTNVSLSMHVYLTCKPANVDRGFMQN